MLYRCRVCEFVEDRGWLPATPCLLYLLFLSCVSVGCLNLAVLAIRATLDLPQRPAEPMPWWGWLVGCLVVMILFVIATAALKYALELLEWIAVRRKPCPRCGQRRWSWGFTGGFGL
jgi:hypothetical protein